MQTQSDPKGPFELRPAGLERSPYWPITLFGGGAALGVLLLIGVRPSDPAHLLYALPMLLFTGVLAALTGRRHPLWGVLLGFLNVLALAASLFYSSSLVPSAAQPSPLRRENLVLPRADAALARVQVQTQASDLDVQAGSRQTLLWARGQHRGDPARLDSRPGPAWQVSLREAPARSSCPECDQSAGQQFWNLHLARALPLELDLETATGNALVDLRSLEVRRLGWRSGTGKLDALLPQRLSRLEAQSGTGDQRVRVPDKAALEARMTSSTGRLTLEWGGTVRGGFALESGTGEQLVRAGPRAALSGRMQSVTALLELVLAEGASGRIALESDTGNVRLDLASDQAVRVRVEGAGEVRLGALRRLEGSGSVGVWQSPDYPSSERRLELSVRTLSGTVSLR